MFRAVPLPIIRSVILYIRHWYVMQVCRLLSSRTRMELHFHPGPACKLSTSGYDIYQCRMYGKKLLMIGRGTVRNM